LHVNLSTSASTIATVTAFAFSGCGGSSGGNGTGSPGNDGNSPPVEHVESRKYTGYYMPSSSMEPTLHCARPAAGCEAEHPDRLLVEPLQSDPSRGDILAFRTPRRAAMQCGAGGVFIKRLIGLPGESWNVQNGNVYINGKVLLEPYIEPQRRDDETLPVHAIPQRMYLMLGDSRNQSCDSRRWGYVPRENIIGKVVKIYRQS
jgi:signal peptidase I